MTSPCDRVAASAAQPAGSRLSQRVLRLTRAIGCAPPGLCAERALLVTRYFRTIADHSEPLVVQKARALAYVLAHQSVQIYDDELLVGAPTSYRVGGALYPELVGLTVLEDIFSIDRRAVNPMQISREHRRRLLTEVLPYWLTRNLVARSLKGRALLRYLGDQTSRQIYVINEAGGIAHLVPDYAALIRLGTAGLRAQALERAAALPANDERIAFYQALALSCDALQAWAARYRVEAERLAALTTDAKRAFELRAIAQRCERVPEQPASSVAEALQTILFAQIALNLESLDNGISPGRLDQIIDPLYQAELAHGTIDQVGAYELLCLFALKLCEIVPVFSNRVTRFHGGLMSGQAVVVGGTDVEGQDATNASSWLWLDLMEDLRVRQPNLHARLHRASPPQFRRRVAEVLASGSVNPAVHNDEVVVPNLVERGVPLAQARDYAIVGCVEPVVAGASFMSTDAALVNVPAALEEALGCAGRWNRKQREAAASSQSVDELYARFESALDALLQRMLEPLQMIERGNALYHPTPLTSLLTAGTFESGRDVTAGGARWNGSGVQGVGVVDVGDAFAAIEQVVFTEQAASLPELVQACHKNFVGHEALRARLRRASKYGNGDARADAWVGRVIQSFASILGNASNSRGGKYIAGFYSMTCHQAFGEVVGALPNGRVRGEPFASGISPQSGMERAGPTAALLSQAALPLSCASNGVNFNMKLAPWIVRGEAGIARLQALLDGALAAGCMQMQFNVIDPALLIEARDNPGKYPGLLVRVSGYSAYFDDLSPSMKQEIIDRTALE